MRRGILLVMLAGLFAAADGYCGEPVIARVSASSEVAGAPAANAVDGDATTGWCADPKSGTTDWWQVEFQPGTGILGAIDMKSGLWATGWGNGGPRLRGHKIRELVWMWQGHGETVWHPIQETEISASRYHLIFRFAPLFGVERLRLSIHGSSAPCLREARFYSDTNAPIDSAPWFYSVATWEEGSAADPLQHWGDPFDLYPVLERSLIEATGRPPGELVDALDDIWIGELNPLKRKGPLPEWVFHEPAPAGFLLSGNYKDFDTVNPSVYAGFYALIQQMAANPGAGTPVLGACGGHQLTAMAAMSRDWREFSEEFTPDNAGQIDVTCSSNPAYGCGTLSAKDCCYEGGSPDPYKWLAQNVPGVALENPAMSTRQDMLFNLLPPEQGIRAFLYHEDYVNPDRIRPRFDVIATYPKSAGGLSRHNPSLVQAMKLRGGRVYGTQFHWDENHAERCDRGRETLDMERVFKNFVFIALNELARPGVRVSATSRGTDASRLVDLDRETMWCSEAGVSEATVTFELPRARSLNAAITVEGRDAGAARAQAQELEASLDGIRWTALGGERTSLYELQRRSIVAEGCDREHDPVSGFEDGQSFLTRFGHATLARFIRIRIQAPAGSPVCLREVMVL